ncbi:MAG TPA: hypothetical protein VLB01_03630 [Thermodesulfobacteriota bacterium]|nr:hypothetical protein [Thermodesulfobacteriota bacterium]
MVESHLIKFDGPPYYAYFEHPDGSWYMVWMTHTDPKTEHGHPWHVHATYDKFGAVRPNLEIRWYEQPYGTKNWDFDTLEEAVSYFYHERYLLRLKHGYRLVIANIPKEWPTVTEIDESSPDDL